MRRIIVIAAGMSGVSTATRIKRRLPEHEINVVLPASLTQQGPLPADAGPAARRHAAELPNLELVASREVGVLEATDIMPDLGLNEVTVGSSRGKLTIRYTDLVVEVAATVRIPRHLQNAGNVFGWPASGFAVDPAPLDAALAEAAGNGRPVVVAGDGIAALDAVFLACEAGAQVHWLRAPATGTPGVDPLLLSLVLARLGDSVRITELQEEQVERLQTTLGGEKDAPKLQAVLLPDGTNLELSCCLWTAPAMGRHPILREHGVILDDQGRITLSGEDGGPTALFLMGDGSAVPGAQLSPSGARMPSGPGARENARFSSWLAVDAITGTDPAGPAASSLSGVLGTCQASMPGVRISRCGLTQEEARRQNLDTEYAVTSLSLADEADATAQAAAGGSGQPTLMLALVCDKRSRTIVGAQALSFDASGPESSGPFAAALAALADGTPLAALARRESGGLANRMLSSAAAILLNKLDTVVKGISPDEYLASREAGAEFFTLDLRSQPDWQTGRVPGAYNIPLPQLKKRLQDEVPRYTPIALVSSDGRDAYAVACRLAGLGATELYVLDGGMHLWPYAMETGA